MSSRVGRREFLKHSAGVAALAAGASVVGAPAVLAERSPNSKLNMVCIGANGGAMAHVPVAASEHLVGLVDIDDGRMGATLDWLDKNVPGTRSKVKTFYDYRKMFDAMHKEVDALFIAIPDHSHACATMMAIKLGKHVYCEKPLTHDIYEARALGEAARQHKVMTQMGNQGHAGESIRVLREYLEAGAIGTVRETHTFVSQYYADQVRQADKPAPTAFIGKSGSAQAAGAIIAPACTPAAARLPGTSGRTTARACCRAWASMPSTPFTGACN